MNIKLINKSQNPAPSYETLLSAGCDLRSNEDCTILPFSRKLVSTGLYIQLPDGYEAQVRPRSGLAIKHGITVLNSPGTIDADYRGEIKVILWNTTSTPFDIKIGDRVAQMVIAKHERAEWELVNELEESERGAGGFGHTGVK